VNFCSHIRQKQSGQSMIYIIGFVPVLVLALLYVFNSNMAVNEKTRLQNTMDAVAYSTAVISAREYNFKAYTNRAMVANQVGIAQAVGLASWVRYMDKLAENGAKLFGPIPVVGEILIALEVISKTLTPLMETLLSGLVTTTDILVQVLSRSQQAFSAASFVLSAEVADKVAQENDKDVDSLSLLSDVNVGSTVFAANQLAESRFSSRYDPDKVRNNILGRGRNNKRGTNGDEDFRRSEEFREITLKSLDKFSDARNHDINAPLATPLLGGSLKKRGGTSLVGPRPDSLARYGTWAAIDTMSLHIQALFFIKLEIAPVAWGAAKTQSRKGPRVNLTGFVPPLGTNTEEYFGGELDVNEKSAVLAAKASNRAKPIQLAPSGGLQGFYDLTLNGLVSRGPKLRLVLSKSKGKVRTNETLGIGKGSVNLDENTDANSKFTSMAAASAYFARYSERADGLREYGNLYNPYWSARLESIPMAEKLLIRGIVAGTQSADSLKGLEP
jgi:hypothetical protein